LVVDYVYVICICGDRRCS